MKYTDEDMLKELNDIRNAVKIDLDEYLEVVRKIEALSKELKKYVNIQIRYLGDIDSHLIKRSNFYFSKTERCKEFEKSRFTKGKQS